jgi:hypothetical protein
MNDLLFYALIIALLYYFFIYLPQKKQSEPAKLTHSQVTQTTNPDPIIKDDSELAELKTKNQQLEKDYQTRIKAQEAQIRQLQTQIRDLAKRPLKPTNSQSVQTEAATELTNTLDTLIKNIQELNQELD